MNERAKLIDWLNAFKADPFSTGADKVDRLIELTAALPSNATEQATLEWKQTLRIVEFRLALSRITEHYPPDTIAGRLAADALARHPNQFENAGRENDSEPFEVEEIKGLPHGPALPSNATTNASLAERVEDLLREAYKRGWREGCETLVEDYPDAQIAVPHFDAMNEGSAQMQEDNRAALATLRAFKDEK